jgi:flagellar biosynthesis/type III secretory pathway protein FliH
MSRIHTIELERPIVSVEILNDSGGDADLRACAGEDSQIRGEQVMLMQQLQAQKADVSQLCAALQGFVDKLEKFYNEVFAAQKEKIANLSLEIARKVLMQKVAKGDYEIESIIQQALDSAATREDMVVHLNPADLAQWEKTQQDGATGDLSGVKFMADASIGRAECILESPKGKIESLIEKHLEQIGKALGEAE